MTWHSVSAGRHELRDSDGTLLATVMRNDLAFGWPWSVYSTDWHQPISEPMTFDQACQWAEMNLKTTKEQP